MTRTLHPLVAAAAKRPAAVAVATKTLAQAPTASWFARAEKEAATQEAPVPVAAKVAVRQAETGAEEEAV